MVRKYKNKFNISIDNVNNFTLAQLQALYDSVAESLAEINMKLEGAKDRLREGAENIDKEWFRRLKGARRAKGYQHQLLARTLKRKKREKHIANIETRFIALKRIVKEYVTPEEYIQILERSEEGLVVEDFGKVTFDENFEDEFK